MDHRHRINASEADYSAACSAPGVKSRLTRTRDQAVVGSQTLAVADPLQCNIATQRHPVNVGNITKVVGAQKTDQQGSHGCEFSL